MSAVKAKVLYLSTAAAVLAAAAVFTYAGSATGQARVYQHQQREWQPSGAAETDGGLCTYLPIVRIETGGQEIPGEAIIGPHGILGFTTTPEGAASANVRVSLIDGRAGENRPDGAPAFTSQALVRYRGNSSRLFDKKSYLLRLVNEDGTENEQEIAGMPSHDEWVLNGPFLDRTLLRNYLCLNAAGQVMEYAPNVRYCELLVDGEYRGVYLIIESISRDEDRIALTKPEKGKNYCSYIVRWDRAGKGDHELENYTFYTYRADVSALDVRYPGRNLLTPGRMAFIERDISKIEKALYSSDLSDQKRGYKAYLDTKSFADYFILNEFFRNVDAGRFSTFYYKDVRGKLKPCVWDFNNACDNYIDYIWDESGFTMQNAPWFSMLLKDEDFVREVVARYHRLRESTLSDQSLCSTIDETAQWLRPAAQRNFSEWGYVFDLENYNGLNYLTPVERNAQSYDEALFQLKDFIIRRGAWLDAHIGTLYQYCHESKNSNDLLR